jgi:transposase
LPWEWGSGRAYAIAAGAVQRLPEEIARAKTRFHVPADAPVISCYEAGRDGFWLHRYLLARGLANHVVDSSSIEVNRRARRAKTDRLDLAGLLSLLARYRQGDHRVWRVVRVPTVAEEDARQLHRTWETLQQYRTRLMNRLKGLLATLGVRLLIDGRFLDRLTTTQLWDGAPIPDGIRQRLTRVWAQLEIVERHLEEVCATRVPRSSRTPTRPRDGSSGNCRRCAPSGR